MEQERFESTPTPLTKQIAEYLKAKGYYLSSPVVRPPMHATDYEYVAWYVARNPHVASIADIDAAAQEIADTNPFEFFVSQPAQESGNLTYPMLRKDTTLFERVGYHVVKHEHALRGVLRRRGLLPAEPEAEEYRASVIQYHYLVIVPNQEIADRAAEDLEKRIQERYYTAMTPLYTSTKEEMQAAGISTSYPESPDW